MSHQLPKISFSYDALEPVIDARTMEIHHAKHHQGYVDKFNTAIKGTELENQPLEKILKERGVNADLIDLARIPLPILGGPGAEDSKVRKNIKTVSERLNDADALMQKKRNLKTRNRWHEMKRKSFILIPDWRIGKNEQTMGF